MPPSSSPTGPPLTRQIEVQQGLPSPPWEITSPVPQAEPSPQRTPEPDSLLARPHNDAINSNEVAATIQFDSDRLYSITEARSIFAYSGEADQGGHRNKRRKLSHGQEESQDFVNHYGHFGQVVPGLLRMEILSCDGGNYTESPGANKEYWAENVLRDDTSVYCTKTRRCNLVLRHQGETPFCLEKIVIKAPRHGFTAPIQEGLIYVSMDMNPLFIRTMNHKIRFSTKSSNHRGRRLGIVAGSTQPLPGTDLGLSSQSLERGPTPPESSESTSSRVVDRFCLESDDERGWSDEEIDACECRSQDCDLHANMGRESSPATFVVTTECSVDPPLSISSASGFDNTDNDSEMSPDSSPIRPSRGRLSGRRPTPSNINPLYQFSQSPSEDISRPTIKTPHARFFIDDDKSMISIKFEPPVSGKYILFKLWRTKRTDNIDIQSISAYGFAGPRYFPAVQVV